ncbi:MAG: DUF4783 domain-containing protein [Bacteroides sp.]
MAMRNLYSLLVPLLFLIPPACAQNNLTSNIEQAITKGIAAQVVPYFGATVDLRILETENVYGSSQAEVLLSNFFEHNPPTSFTIIHRKTRTDNTFFIGTYVSKGLSFRISVFMKKEQNSLRITQILIQNATEN